jgi:hypothetical protein
MPPSSSGHRRTDLHEIRVPSSWVTNMDDATIRKAALYVAWRARDVNDARLLLTALGIIDEPERIAS